MLSFLYSSNETPSIANEIKTEKSAQTIYWAYNLLSK